MSKLKKQTVSGIKWLVMASFFTKALSVATMVILARILNPSIFGIFALAFVAIDGLGLFKSMGFDSALMRKKDNIEKAANTAFFIIPVLGTSLFLILSVVAPYVGRFLNSQEIIPVIRVLGLIFIFNCFAMVPKVLLQKEMRFAKVAFSETASVIIYSSVAISLALLGFGIWSLVIGYLAKTLLIMVAFWYFAKWKPKWVFDKKIALEMFHFGKFLFLDSLVHFFRGNLDNLLVGKLLGVVSLGLYAVSYNISSFAATYFTAKVSRVVFPAYSKLQDNLGSLRLGFLKVFKHISLFVLPFGMVLFLLAGESLRLIYGEKWIGAANTLRILAWAGIFNTLHGSTRAVFMACGKPKLSFWITSLQVIIFLIFIAPMARLFGVEGVAMVVALSAFIAFIFTMTWVKNLLSIKLSQFYGHLKPSLISTLFMAFAIIFFKNILLQHNIDVWFQYKVILLFCFAAGIYIFSLLRMEKTLFRDVKELILTR